MAKSHTHIQNWKLRPIFVSSTFLDMQAERDHLRNFVLPKLEEKLADHKLHVEWIDLRQGVDLNNVEGIIKHELQVLKVCFGEIARSRPFVIILLGDRYGWIPPFDCARDAMQAAGFSTDVLNKSVTALEVEYATAGDLSKVPCQCFFYLRESLPYDDIPLDLRSCYCDKFAEDSKAVLRYDAVRELRKRICNDPRTKSRVRKYQAHWDKQKRSVVGLEAWGQQVYEDLWNELKTEVHKGKDSIPRTWMENERAELEQFVERSFYGFVGRTELLKELLEFAHSPISFSIDDLARMKSVASYPPGIDIYKISNTTECVPWGRCVTGHPGSGKSAVYSALHRKLEIDSDILLLSNAAGATVHGSRVDSMLLRWIDDLASFLGIRKDQFNESETLEELDQVFHRLLERASEKKRVVILLDALDQFEPTQRAKYLTWLPKPVFGGVRLVIMSRPDLAADLLLHLSDKISLSEIPPLAEQEARSIAQKIWERWHVPWSNEVWRTLREKKNPSGFSATSNPLWTTLACSQLTMLDSDDFVRAQVSFPSEHTMESKLAKLRSNIAESMPPEVTGLYRWLFRHAEKIHGRTHVRSFICAIAVSRHGWRESDLQVIIPLLGEILIGGGSAHSKHMVWDAVMTHVIDRYDNNYNPCYASKKLPIADLADVRRTFHSSLILRNEFQWDIFHDVARSAVRSHLALSRESEKAVHRIIATYLVHQRIDDPVRCDEIAFHLLEACEYHILQIFYGSNDTTQQREIVATTRTLVDFVKQHGFSYLNKVSNIDVSAHFVDSEGNLVQTTIGPMERINKDLKMSVARGWCRRCVEELMPALSIASPVGERRILVENMLKRLLESLNDFPDDEDLKTVISRIRLVAAELATTQGDWNRAQQLTNDVLSTLDPPKGA